MTASFQHKQAGDVNVSEFRKVPGYERLVGEEQRIRILIQAGRFPLRRIWVLSSLERSEPDCSDPAPQDRLADAAGSPSILIALAYALFQMAIRASLRRATSFLRALWCRILSHSPLALGRR